MGVQFTNNALSTLRLAISAVATSLTIDASTASRFPQPLTGADWFPLTLIDPSGALEIVHCTARSGNVLTVTRAREGTTARAFPAYTTVEHRITAASMASSDIDSLTKTTTGNRIGLYTYNLSQRPEPYITPRDLGGLPNGQDIRPHLLDCFDIAVAEGFNRVCLDGNGWFTDGYIEPPANIELFGRSRGFDKIEIKINGGRTSPAIWVLKNNIHIHDLEIMCNDNDAIPGWPVSGFGDMGTCITCSKYVPQGETPPAVSGFKAERLLLTRKAGTRVAGGIMLMAGSRHSSAHDIIVDGTKGAKHSIAVQSHWGCKSGATNWDLIAPSMHPHEIVYDNFLIRGCSSGLVLSSAYNILAQNFDMDGVGNMLTILPGDEGNWLAPADEKASIQKNLHCKNFVGRNLVYEGEGNYQVSVTSRGVSKGRYDADNPAMLAYTSVPVNVLLENFQVDGGGTVPDVVTVRYCGGMVTLKNFNVDGATGDAYDVQNNNGQVTLENCRASAGRINMIANGFLTVDGCRIIGDYDKSHATGKSGLFAEGRVRTATLAADAIAGAEKLTLTAPFTYPMQAGDKIELAPGNVCYATEAFSSAASVIRVTPVIAPALSGATITLDKRNQEIKVRNGTLFDNVYRGIEASDTAWLDVEGAIIRRTGQYGILTSLNVRGSVRATRFIAGGIRRSFEAGYSTRDILMQTACQLDLRENHYGVDSNFIDKCVIASSDSLGGFDRDSLYYKWVGSAPYDRSCPAFEFINPRNANTMLGLDRRTSFNIGTRFGTVAAGGQGTNASWYEILPNRLIRMHGDIVLTSKAGGVTGKVTFNTGLTAYNPILADIIGSAAMVTSAGLTGDLTVRTEIAGVVASQYIELMQQTPTGRVPVTDAQVLAGTRFIFDIVYPY